MERYLSKVANFPNLTIHVHFSALILRLAVLIQYRCDRQTDTNRHTTTA